MNKSDFQRDLIVMSLGNGLEHLNIDKLTLLNKINAIEEALKISTLFCNSDIEDLIIEKLINISNLKAEIISTEYNEELNKRVIDLDSDDIVKYAFNIVITKLLQTLNNNGFFLTGDYKEDYTQVEFLQDNGFIDLETKLNFRIFYQAMFERLVTSINEQAQHYEK